MACIELLERLQPTVLVYAMQGIIFLEAPVSYAQKIPLLALDPTAAGNVCATLVSLETSPLVLMCAPLVCQGRTNNTNVVLWLVTTRCARITSLYAGTVVQVGCAYLVFFRCGVFR